MQKDIQKAIVIDFNRYKKVRKEYKIAYIGNEFCQNLIPSYEQVEKTFTLGFKKVVIFVPFLTENKFKQYIDLILNLFKKYMNKIEVSTSDLGIINYLNKKQPQIIKNISRPLSIEFVRMKDEILKKTLKELNISAIETDELIFVSKLTKNNINVYFHTKLAFVATQRHCAFVKKITDECNKVCVNKKIRIKIPQSNATMIVKNNVYLKEIRFKKISGVRRLIYWF